MGRASQRPLGAGLALAALITVIPGAALSGAFSDPTTGGSVRPASDAGAAALDGLAISDLARSSTPTPTHVQARFPAPRQTPPETDAATASSATSSPTPGPATGAPSSPPSTALPDGHANYVIALMGGSRNAYWVRLAEYSFATGSPGRVRQSYWSWSEAGFRGGASTNKVATGYVTRGCEIACTIRTPVGFQPSAAPKSLDGTYRVDARGHLVIRWSDGHWEAWGFARRAGTSTRLALFATSFNALYGDGLGSNWSFSAGASRDAIAPGAVAGTQHSAVYCSIGDSVCHRGYVRSSPWTVDFGDDYKACPRSTCLFLYAPRVWRSYWAIDPAKVGRRVYWEIENEGVDHYWGACFSAGGGHTWALLQAVDDTGRFAGFVGVEASLNGRSEYNAVVSEVMLRPV